jgi:hypothetical protein
MARKHAVTGVIGAALLVYLTGGCSGGGGGGGSSGGTGSMAGAAEDDQVVVGYDHNNDQQLDVLTLDSTTSPFRIVTALEGTPAGGFVDRTAQRAGQAIDTSISDALAAYLASSIALVEDTEVDVVDSVGRDVTVTVYE